MLMEINKVFEVFLLEISTLKFWNKISHRLSDAIRIIFLRIIEFKHFVYLHEIIDNNKSIIELIVLLTKSIK